jgi:hypothetical protein
MKKYIFVFSFYFFTILISCGNSLTNTADIVGKYIKENELPITIGEEIIVYNDFNMTDKTKYQIFMMDLINKFSDDISEGNFNDKTIENLIEAQRILTGFYKYCTNYQYELAIIFGNKYNEKDLLIDYFEYYNYNLTFYNNWVIFDNNTHYTELKNLIGILLQIGDIARDNLINFLHGWNGEYEHLYKKNVFIDGKIGTIDMDYLYLDVVMEVERMNICYYLIADILYLFKIKGYNLDLYENIWEEIIGKNREFEKLIYEYNNRGIDYLE